MSSKSFLHAHDCSEPHTDAVWGVVWTTADTVISVSADGDIKQWTPTTGKPQLPKTSSFPPRHVLGLTCVSASPDGQRILYNSLEGLTSLWDLTRGEVVAKFESYVRKSDDSEPSWSVHLNPKGETYSSCGGSGNVFVHSAKESNFGERLTTLKSGRHKFGMCCRHSPDGRKVAMSVENGQIFIFDLETGSLMMTNTAHAMAVRSLSWAPDSNLLISASNDKRLGLHDVRSAQGGIIASMAGHSSWVLSVDVSTDGQHVVTGSADKTMRIWDIGTRNTISVLQDTGQGQVWTVSWRPKGGNKQSSGSFVSGGEDGIVKWWRGAGVEL